MHDCQICAARADDHEWFVKEDRLNWEKQFDGALQENWEMPSPVALLDAVEEPPVDTGARFNELAAVWSKRTRFISSVSDIVSDPAYQEIIKLGWKALPYLLADLESNKRFWFPALYAITGIRPFDSRDAGNGRRMTEAWIGWGKRKKLI